MSIIYKKFNKAKSDINISLKVKFILIMLINLNIYILCFSNKKNKKIGIVSVDTM